MPLPDFLIIGTAKAGTTAAVDNLNLHPEIHVGPQRIDAVHGPEWHRFFRDEGLWRKGIQWYADLFCTDKRLLGDKNTSYLAWYATHGRIHEAMPGAKLIVLLRNPVDRAFSHWNHFNHTPGDSDPNIWRITSFEEAMGLGGGATRWHHTELRWYGHYFEQLSSLFRHFPREAVHVAISERVRKNPAAAYAEMFRFLGADPAAVDPGHFGESLRAAEWWPYPGPMDPDTRRALVDYYRIYNEGLFELLGYRIPEWAESGGPVSSGRRSDRRSGRPGASALPSSAGGLAGR